ncbi:DedA family protein [Paenibacillus terrigena]|uniref:DedA family protein n=1 Tax=Paenibacillus terrigena TaxID=369333 RepID=UPI0028D070A2|nr:DedA family protein [Paenibacillus terrigena]
MHQIEQLFHEYGYFVLFFGLLLEFIALPFPGETTMAFAGYLSYMGRLNWMILIIVAFFGTTIGMTITYFIGHAVGMPFIRKYGKWFFLSTGKVEKTEKWFGKYGNGLIFIGYFIPGVRHFTGYFAGIIRLPFRKFAIYAYTGALFWVIVFIWLGKFFGPQWNRIFKLVEHNALYVAIGVIVILVAVVLIKYRKRLFGK